MGTIAGVPTCETVFRNGLPIMEMAMSGPCRSVVPHVAHAADAKLKICQEPVQAHNAVEVSTGLPHTC